MKALLLTLLLLSATTVATANPYVVYAPKARLAGETVYARISKEAASVTAVLEFEEWSTDDSKIVYFPIFAAEASDPITVLSKADLEFEVDGRKVGVAAPCEAPQGLAHAHASCRIYWFSANLDELVDEGESVEILNRGNRVVVRFTYSQPLIEGGFYYLPIIPGQSGESSSWNYQMFVRSDSKPLRVASKGTEFFVLEDVISVHLRDREIVEIR